MASKDKPVPISSLQLEESQTRKAIYGVIGGVIKDTEIDTLTSRLNKWGYLFRWYLANVLKYKEQVEACTSHKETEKLKKKFHKEFKKIISEPVLH
jgi:hypothetical protein